MHLLQVKSSSKRGLLWSEGENCVGWRYPYARAVTLLTVEPHPDVVGTHFDLSYFSLEAGDYISVPLRAVARGVPASGTASTAGGRVALLLFAEHAVAAEEWQLVWGEAGAAGAAAEMLGTLRVNPWRVPAPHGLDPLAIW